MPKKAHGRPAKARNRSRRPAARPVPAAGDIAPADQDLIAERVPVTAVSPSVQPLRATSAVSAAPSARRGAAANRRAPATAVNYHYLRRDITTLSILAPAMVVVLIILFFVLHY